MLQALFSSLRDRLVRPASEEGASATEYAVIVAIVVGALVALGVIFGDTLESLWQSMVDLITDNFL